MLKLNCDGAFNDRLGHYGGGAILRDEFGVLVAAMGEAYSQKGTVCFNELLAIKLGLEMVLERRSIGVVVESDSLEAVRLVNGDEQCFNVEGCWWKRFNYCRPPGSFSTTSSWDKCYCIAASLEVEDEWKTAATTDPLTLNVMDFGARGNGEDDDSQAFLKAWGALCGSNDGRTPSLLIPKDRAFLLNPLVFEGPCEPKTLNFLLQGRLVAPDYNSKAWRSDKEKWVQFSDVDGLTISGGGLGVIDGKGSDWWQACDKSDCDRPAALEIHKCDDLRLNGVTHINSAKAHIKIFNCNRVQVSGLLIWAPEESPNTDGIQISSSTNVNIENSAIGTGDDCIAIITGSSQIQVTGVRCGPGHGISIGSLWKDGAYATVEDVNVRNCSLRGTQNGLRIKTWQGGKGYARKITYEGIRLIGSKNPIIIDQHYVDKGLSRPEEADDHKSSVQVSDVTYRGVFGSSADEVAINLNCAGGRLSCRNIVMVNIHITSSLAGQKTSAYCNNGHGTATLATPTSHASH
ncbi:hypothetical protein M0R45_021436 [Rubus argutus]|uniref:RNase H type-1 domain-containing protein n=1 Tax=Rubus argutus TaxID=59490 RepID=A0AAW1XDN8_RUBAR